MKQTRADARRLTNPASATFKIADYPFYRIARVAGLYSKCLERELKPRGMDQPRWRVLMILNEHSPIAMGAIAQIAVMKLPTVLKLVKRMADEGLVRYAPRPSDQRVTEVSITPSGRKSVTIVRRVAGEVYAHVTNDLSADDVLALNALMERIEVSLTRMHRGHKRSAA